MFGKNSIVGKKYFKDAALDQLFVTSMFMTLQGEGPYRGEPAFFIRLAKCNLNCSFCFVPSTRILMGDGKKKKIIDVEIGDVVMSWDKDKFVQKKVINKFKNVASKLLKIETNSMNTWVTPEHPFLISGKGWVKAEDLKKGDKFVHFSMNERMTMFNHTNKPDYVHPRMSKKAKEAAAINNGLEVKSVTEVKGLAAFVRLFGSKDAPHDVYNIEVEDTHTYIANGCVVHNCDTFFDDGDWLTFDQIEERIEESIDTFFTSQGVDRPDWTRSQNKYGYTKPKKMVLVITGGEPMLQENLGPFLDYMQKLFEKTQIETNGTQNTLIPTSTTLVCSPKCSEKNGVAVKYLEPREEILERADCLKFVMCADKNSPYSDIPQWAHDWAKHTDKPIFISPMNIYNDLPQKAKKHRAEHNSISIEERSTVDEVISFWEEGLLNMPENQKNHEYAAKFCVNHGYILNLQIHLYASLA